MRLACISDVHITGLADPAQAAFVRWLDTVDADVIALLGDIFHAWWGFCGVVETELVPACAALIRARDRGQRLIVVPGNHDFALGPFFHDVLGAEVCGPHLRRIDGRAVFLAHGDEADPTPGYRVTRRLLRSRAMAAVVRGLGPVRSRRMLHGLAGASRHVPADPNTLRQQQQAWARTHIDNGADYVVLGHIHAPGTARVGAGEVVHLGGFGHDRVWWCLDGGRGQLVTAAADGTAR